MFKVWTNGYYKEYEVLKETQHQIVFYRNGNKNPSSREAKFGSNYRWVLTEEDCIMYLIEHYEKNIIIYNSQIKRANENIADANSKINNWKSKLSII